MFLFRIGHAYSFCLFWHFLIASAKVKAVKRGKGKSEEW